MTLKKSRNS